MSVLQNSYRTWRRIVRPFFAALIAFLCVAASGQQPQKQAGLQAGAQAQPAAGASSANAAAAQQSTIAAAMGAAMDQQRQAVRTQVGSSTPTDDFFTVPWVSPPSIAAPLLVPACSPMPEQELTPIVARNAKEQDIKPELIRAVIKHESASYPCAVSYRGALGLMQLMPDTADRFKADPLDPAQNVRAGTQYLKELLKRYKGDTKLALAAYNAGPERVDADKKVPEIAETIAYVDAILKDLNQNAASGH